MAVAKAEKVVRKERAETDKEVQKAQDITAHDLNAHAALKSLVAQLHVPNLI